MKTKYILALFLILPFIVFAGWLYNIHQSLNAERDVTVTMTGYDPKDLLSGHYLLLRPDWRNTDCTQFEDNHCPTWQFSATYRYYLPEEKAIMFDKISNVDKMEIVFAYQKNSTPMVKSFLVGGMKWDDWLNRYLESLGADQSSN